MNDSRKMLRSVTLIDGVMNQVAATLIVRFTVENARSCPQAALVRVEVFELGYDGSTPEIPLALATPTRLDLLIGQSNFELGLRIGTPFLWSAESRPCYSMVISIKSVDCPEQLAEIQFGFDSEGRIVVTREMKAVVVAASGENPTLPSLYVVGDSTAFSNGRNQRGWGDELAKYLDPVVVTIRNRARPGRSTRSFRREGLWARVLAEMKAGDYVLIQFGHNDADHLAEGRCRGVLTGVGEETCDVTMPDGDHEVVHTFGWYLRQFVAQTQARHAVPVILSLSAKNIWYGGKLIRHQSEYGVWSAAVAAACGVSFVDLTEAIADRYEALGMENVQWLFCSDRDNVHTSLSGAELNAHCVAAGLIEMKLFPRSKDLNSNRVEAS